MFISYISKKNTNTTKWVFFFSFYSMKSFGLVQCIIKRIHCENGRFFFSTKTFHNIRNNYHNYFCNERRQLWQSFFFIFFFSAATHLSIVSFYINFVNHLNRFSVKRFTLLINFHFLHSYFLFFFTFAFPLRIFLNIMAPKALFFFFYAAISSNNSLLKETTAKRDTLYLNAFKTIECMRRSTCKEDKKISKKPSEWRGKKWKKNYLKQSKKQKKFRRKIDTANCGG